MKELMKKYHLSADYIKGKLDVSNAIGLILGSGLGEMADEIEDPKTINYEDYN